MDDIDMLCSICYNTCIITYNLKSDIKSIRLCFGLSQSDFANAIKVSRSNIARYEAGTITPHSDVIERIYNYSLENGFDINKAKTMIYEDRRNGKLILFHGAKNELVGDVDTKHSKGPNDFGDGFYLGETLKQANMWVSLYEKSSTYCFYLNLDETFKGIKFDVDYNWMMAILYFRGELDGYQIPDFLKTIIDDVSSSDYIIAPIADNQMYDTIEMFRNGIISDVACLHALNANNLGYQYVLKSERICKKLIPVDRLYLASKEKEYYLNLKKESNKEGDNKVKLAIMKYRKEGKMFNEIFKEEKR